MGASAAHTHLVAGRTPVSCHTLLLLHDQWPQSAPVRAPLRAVRKILKFVGTPLDGVPMLQMETHRYDIELKSEDNETPVARHPVTVQVSVRCFMHELHKVTPLEPLSETDWQCVRQLVAEAPALRFCAAGCSFCAPFWRWASDFLRRLRFSAAAPVGGPLRPNGRAPARPAPLHRLLSLQPPHNCAGDLARTVSTMRTLAR